MVPTGVTGFWANSFDYPDWLTDGTDIPAGKVLPKMITMVDDLQIMANLIGHAGERRLVELVLEWPRFPTQSLSLAAPDLGAALEYLSGAITYRNAFMSLAFHRDAREGCVILTSDDRLGPFRPLLESVLWVVLYRVARVFLGFGPNVADVLAGVRIRSAHAATILAPLLACQTGRSAGPLSEMRIVSDALEVTNPEFDPDLWHRIAARDASADPPSTAVSNIGEIVPILRSALADAGRVPQQAEIATLMNMSSRSFARAMSEAGLSYRDLVSDTRMALAREMLVKGRTPVKDIALRLGYGDVSAFVRAFRRSHGVSPTRWTQAAGAKK